MPFATPLPSLTCDTDALIFEKSLSLFMQLLGMRHCHCTAAAQSPLIIIIEDSATQATAAVVVSQFRRCQQSSPPLPAARDGKSGAGGN